MSEVSIANRNYVIGVDRSGSMSKEVTPGKTRYKVCQETTEALARACQPLDPDGITVIVFNNDVKMYDNVTPDKVEQVFTECQPMGSTATDKALEKAFDLWRKDKTVPMTIICVTDGEPDDKAAVKKSIIKVTQEMDTDEQLAILFYQAGNDPAARAFLKELDDDLQGMGAKFDIVDTKNDEELSNMTIEQALLEAITD